MLHLGRAIHDHFTPVPSPHKAPHGTHADLRYLQVIGARAVVRVGTHAKMLDPHAWEGRLVGNGRDSLAYHIYPSGSQTVR